MDVAFHLLYRDYFEPAQFQEHVCCLDQKLSKGKKLLEVKKIAYNFKSRTLDSLIFLSSRGTSKEMLYLR